MILPISNKNVIIYIVQINLKFFFHPEVVNESPNISNRRTSIRRISQLPIRPGRFSSYSLLQQKIQQEELMEKRALRQAAELQLERTKLELEKLKWEFEKEKYERDFRWAHECQMMQIREQQEIEMMRVNNSRDGV